MSGNELEPYIAKSVKLLFATDEDSVEQMRALLEETIKSKYGPKKAQAIANLVHSVGEPRKRRFPDSVADDDVDDDEDEDDGDVDNDGDIEDDGDEGDDDDEEEDEEEEENNAEDEDDANVVEEVEEEDEVPIKRIKLSDTRKSGFNSPTFENSSSTESDDLTMDIFEENLCVVCRNVGSGPMNRIVECMDCHDLYHQNCAAPPIEADVTDPRFVWYCQTCNKGSNKTSPSCSINKAIVTTGVSTTNSGTISSGSSTTSGGATAKPLPMKLSASNTSRTSTMGSFVMANKPFGNKFRLLKTIKR